MPKADCYLGFDFGTKKIGCAVGQSLTRSATPLKKIPVRQSEIRWELIQQYIKEWQPSALVVGLPLNMDGTEQNITQLAKQFAKDLEKRYQLSVYLVDERLSTRDARERVFEMGGYKALQNTDIDSLAAKLILEMWLQDNENL